MLPGKSSKCGVEAANRICPLLTNLGPKQTGSDLGNNRRDEDTTTLVLFLHIIYALPHHDSVPISVCIAAFSKQRVSGNMADIAEKYWSAPPVTRYASFLTGHTIFLMQMSLERW